MINGSKAGHPSQEKKEFILKVLYKLKKVQSQQDHDQGSCILGEMEDEMKSSRRENTFRRKCIKLYDTWWIPDGSYKRDLEEKEYDIDLGRSGNKGKSRENKVQVLKMAQLTIYADATAIDDIDGPQ